MKDLMEDFNAGEFSGFLYSGGVSSIAVSGIANQVLRKARSVKPTGDSAREMRRIARDLETAAECYRQAAALAFPAPVVLQAAE